MSLNWREIDLVLSEWRLEGAQIQKIIQSNYDTLSFSVYGRQGAQTVLFVIKAGACRLHLTKRAVPKNDKPLRFAELLKSRILNARIGAIRQLGSDRIVQFTLHQGKELFFLYVRLWSNAANCILTTEDGIIIDAMRRLPRRGEVAGAPFPQAAAQDSAPQKPPDFAIRETPAGISFNEHIDTWYAENGGSVSLEALRAEAQKKYNVHTSRLNAALERLAQKEAEYGAAERLKEYGSIILAHAAALETGAAWLDAENFFESGADTRVHIKLDPRKTPQENAALYFDEYRKAKKGLSRVQEERACGAAELVALKKQLDSLLDETNPLRLEKQLKTAFSPASSNLQSEKIAAIVKKRPGLGFKRGDWLLLVGRSAAENDELLRKHVKGNDLWLHVRDYAGSYVFVKARPGKSIPLDILLDAGTLALFYSKGRKAGKGDLFYTPVKYLRRVKNGKRGMVIPLHEKNLSIELDETRLQQLESCRLETV